MQIHHTTGTVFAFNAWSNGQTNDVGIGTRSSDNPDWTWSESAGWYTTRTLEVYAINPGPTPVPTQLPTPPPTKDKTITFTDVAFGLTVGCDTGTNSAYFRLGDCQSAGWEANLNPGGSAMITRICVHTKADESSSRDQADDMKLNVDSVLKVTHYNE